MTEIIVKKCPYCNGTGKQFYLNQDGKVSHITGFMKIEKVIDESEG